MDRRQHSIIFLDYFFSSFYILTSWTKTVNLKSVNPKSLNPKSVTLNLTAFFPCALRHVIYLEDAQQGIYKLKEALKAASQNKLYAENKPASDGSDEVRKVEKIDRV